MDVFIWLLVAFGAVTFLFSRGKNKPKQGHYKGGSEGWKSKQGREKLASEVIREENTAEKQLTTVKNNEFRKRPLMNKSEYAVFCKLEALLSKSHQSYRVFAQVSLGEILRSDNKLAYWAINSKRADFVIIDRTGHPVAVVEFHGAGHYQGDASVRDAVKREACNSAGIAFIELQTGYSATDIEAIGEQLTRKAA